VACTLDEIVTEVQKSFDQVSMEQIAGDVKEFLNGILAIGFIGTMEAA